MKKINGITVYEEQDKCSLDEYSESLANDIPKVIDAKTNAIKTDISNIKQEQQDQNSKIENNTTQNEEQADLLNQIVNILPTTTGEGEYVTLQDTAEIKFKKFEVQGNSKQETRSGKNAIKSFNRVAKQHISWVIDKNKLEKTMYFSLISSKALAQTNTIFFNAIDGSLTAINKSAMVIKANEKSIRQIDFTDEELNTIKNSDKDIIIQIYENNTEIDCTAITFREVMLASSNDTNYEEYGASPSPEYPSKIRNVGDNVNFKITNQNLINTNILASKGQSSIIDIGINSFTVDLSKGNISAFSDKQDLFFGNLPQNKKYIFSYTIEQNNDTFLPYLGLKYTDGTLEIVHAQTSTTYKAKLISKKDVEGIYIGWKSQVGGGRVTFSDIQLSVADIEFKENEEQSFIFPLDQEQRLYKGDYLADDGIHHVRKQIILDGTETWQLGGTGNNTIYQRFYISKNFIKANGDITSNYFKQVYKGSVDIFHNDVEGCNISNGQYIQIKINKKIANTVDELNAWILQKKKEGNPLIFECELEKEEIDPYTPEQQEAYNKQKKLHSYNEQTNIFSTNVVSPVFNVEAIKNLNATFAQLSATMLERG